MKKKYQNGDGKESVYGEEEPTINYIKLRVRIFHLFFYSFLFCILFMKISLFEAVNYFDVCYGSDNVIMCVLAEIFCFSFLFFSTTTMVNKVYYYYRTSMKSCRLVM